MLPLISSKKKMEQFCQRQEESNRLMMQLISQVVSLRKHQPGNSSHRETINVSKALPKVNISEAPKQVTLSGLLSKSTSIEDT